MLQGCGRIILSAVAPSLSPLLYLSLSLSPHSHTYTHTYTHTHTHTHKEHTHAELHTRLHMHGQKHTQTHTQMGHVEGLRGFDGRVKERPVWGWVTRTPPSTQCTSDRTFG